MGDTPATLRRELVRTQSRLKSDQGGSGAALPPPSTSSDRLLDPSVGPASYSGAGSPYDGLGLEAPRELPPIDSTAQPASPEGNAPSAYPSTATAGVASETKTEALQLLKAAREAMQQGDLDTASRLASQASNLNLPESAFGPAED